MVDEILVIIITSFYKLINRSITEKKIEVTVQFIKFCLVGLSNVIISYIFYLTFYKIFNTFGIHGKANYITAQIIGFVLSIFWSFYWNNKYVFGLGGKNKHDLLFSFVKMFLSYSVTGIVLNSILLVLWIEFFDISAVLAPVLNLIICVPLNFLLNKYWAFNK